MLDDESDRGVRGVSAALRWVSMAAIAVALALFYVLTAGAEDLAGRVARVADGDTITLLTPDNQKHKIRIGGIDAPEKRQAFGNRSKQNRRAGASRVT